MTAIFDLEDDNAAALDDALLEHVGEAIQDLQQWLLEPARPRPSSSDPPKLSGISTPIRTCCFSSLETSVYTALLGATFGLLSASALLA
jgi:hypothetical protein